MTEHPLCAEQISAYGQYLRTEERSSGTVEKYLRDVTAFAVWLDGGSVTKEVVTEWKESLQLKQYAPATINGALAALNSLFRFLG